MDFAVIFESVRDAFPDTSICLSLRKTKLFSVMEQRHIH